MRTAVLPRDEIFSTCGASDAVLRVAHAMADVARELAASTPRPRGQPFFSLDVSADYDLRVFDELPSRGIFRKYEFALDVGCGLGGRGRWLAGRTGCRVVGVDSHEAFAHAAAELNARAHMSDQVSFKTAKAHALGVRSEAFTHVWMIDMNLEAGLRPIIGEGLRVLRKGGHLVLQVDAVADSSLPDTAEILRDVGFVDIERREVALPDLAPATRSARDRLREMLKRSWPDSRVCEGLWVERPTRRVVQVFGRRPA